MLELKPRLLLLWLAVAGLCAQSGAALGTSREARPPGRVGTLQIPGRPLGSFDTVYVNARGVFALSDRSNRGLDFFSAASGKFLGRAGGFRGYDHAAGLEHGGPDGSVAVGPSEFWAGDGDASRVMNVLTGKLVARLPQVGGVDQVWSDRRTGRYYLAAYANPGGPMLAVFDLRTNRWIANVPTGPHAHSVAADVSTGKVFVPIAAGGSAGDCANGCVAVYGLQGK